MKKNKSGIKKNIAGGSNMRRARQGAVVPMMKGGVVKMAGGGMSSPRSNMIAGPGVKPDRSVTPKKPRVGGKPMNRVGQRPIGNNPPIKKMARGGKAPVKKMARGGKAPVKKMGRGGKLKK